MNLRDFIPTTTVTTVRKDKKYKKTNSKNEFTIIRSKR